MTRPRHAVLLAAGMGTRLAGAHDGPKCLVELGGEALLLRSIRLLDAAGIDEILVVVGHRREALAAVLPPRVRLVDNTAYATTGTLRSLACALSLVSEDVLLLEGDLAYEPRALSVVLDDPRPDLVLCSGLTGAGDEVWVEVDGDRLVGLSKDRARLRDVHGELVGICKLSAHLCRRLVDHAARSDPRASYETDAFMALAPTHPLHVLRVPDLVWGELDDAHHLARLRRLHAEGRLG